MVNILISGAASGLGKAFCHAYAAQNSAHKIYVLDRAFANSSDSFSLLDFPQPRDWVREHVMPIVCDVTDAAAIAEAVGSLNVELDLVIHSAGIRGLVPKVPLNEYKDVAVADCLEVMDSATMTRTFEINTVGTFLLLRALLPWLRFSKPLSADPSNLQSPRVPKVVVMGSRMGSVGHNTQLGGAYAYRASKAALNAVVKSFSVDIPEVTWVVMHPGRVETGLVAIKEDDAMDANQIVQELLPLIDDITPKDTGRFIDRFGVDIPW